MSIDPMHLPIFGDPRPVSAPAAVRASVALLVVHAGVTVGSVVQSGVEPTLFVFSVALTVWFVYWVAEGRDWARVAACLSGFSSLFLSLGAGGGVVGLVLVVVSAVLLVSAARLMFRADVREYFESVDSEAL
ncbi:hypothetical protein ACFQV2_19370 [Actinokineospora soli]|uniref:SPW repeat-containing protein n=1 Tax=Actinokineospora soli TaxID=1048753 RepID=A0ABW2TNG7_9PSEU